MCILGFNNLFNGFNGAFHHLRADGLPLILFEDDCQLNSDVFEHRFGYFVHLDRR